MIRNFTDKVVSISVFALLVFTTVLLTSSASLAQEEKTGFLGRLFGDAEESQAPVSSFDTVNIAWKSELPHGLYDGDYSTCVPVSGTQKLGVESTVMVHFERPAKVIGAAVYVRRLSKKGDVSGEFSAESYLWDSSLGKVSQLGTNATAKITLGSPTTTSELKFEITDISGPDANVCLTELEVYGSVEEEEGAPTRRIGLVGNWIAEYSDAGKKGNTTVLAYSLWPNEDTNSTGVWNLTDESGSNQITVNPEGKIHIQHRYGFMGLWGGESNLKQVGPDEIRGRWNYQGRYGGAVVWRRVQPEVSRITMNSQVVDDYDPRQRPGRVEETYEGWIWAPGSSDMRANRPNFHINLYGKNLWGRHNIRVEPQLESVSLVASDLELRCCGRIKGAGNGPPSDVIGLNMEVLAWQGAVPGRKTLYIDDVAIPFDFIVHGHPMENKVVWPKDATTSGDLQKVNLRVVGLDGKSLDKITGDTPFRIKVEYKESPEKQPTSSELSWTSVDPEFPSGTAKIPVTRKGSKSKAYQSALYFLAPLSSRDRRDVSGFPGDPQASANLAAELFAGEWNVNHAGGSLGNRQGVAVVSDDGSNVSLFIGTDKGPVEYESFEIMATRDSKEGRHTLDVRFKRKDKTESAGASSSSRTSSPVPLDASGVTLMQPTTGSDRVIPSLPDRPLVPDDVPGKKPKSNYQIIYIADGAKAITAKAAGESVEVAVELPAAPPEKFRISLMVRESGTEMSGAWSNELTNGDLASAGNQRWARDTTKVEGVIVVDNQLDASAGYNYPYESDGSSTKHLRTSRTLIIYGFDLPEFSDGTVIKSLSDDIEYQVDSRSASDRELVIEKAFKGAQIKNPDQYDAFLVTALLAKGIKPGIKTLSVNKENLPWPLLFSNQRAAIRFVRNSGEAEIATRVFYPGDIAYVKLSFESGMPFKEIPIMISTGRINSPLEHGVLLAKLQDDDELVLKNYVTEPIHLYHGSKPSLSPPDDENALRIPVFEGAEINASLVDPAEALTFPPVARAKVFANPNQLGPLWKEALDRVAVCNGETVEDYNKFQREKALGISKTIFFARFGKGPARTTRKISIQKGDQAAAILIRDQFIQSTMEMIPRHEVRAKNIEYVRAYRKRAKSSEALANEPFWRSFEAIYVEKGEVWDSKTMVPLAKTLVESMTAKKFNISKTVPLAETLDEGEMAKKFGISLAAAKTWAEEQTMAALSKQVESMYKSVSWAQDAGDCKMDKLLLIAGHRSPALVGQILPRLVKLNTDVGPPKRQYWVPDKPAQSFVKGLYITGEAVRALEQYSEADTDVGLAVAAIATIGTVAALEAFEYAGAALWTNMVLDAAEVAYGAYGVKEYIDAENYYDFAKGTVPALGEGVFNEASAKRQSGVMTAVGVLLPTVSGMSSLSRLRHFKNVQRGKALFAKSSDVLDGLSTLEEVDRVGLAGYYTDMLARVKKSGIDKLDDADRAALDAFQGYFKGQGIEPPSIARTGGATEPQSSGRPAGERHAQRYSGEKLNEALGETSPKGTKRFPELDMPSGLTEAERQRLFEIQELSNKRMSEEFHANMERAKNDPDFDEKMFGNDYDSVLPRSPDALDDLPVGQLSKNLTPAEIDELFRSGANLSDTQLIQKADILIRMERLKRVQRLESRAALRRRLFPQNEPPIDPISLDPRLAAEIEGTETVISPIRADSTLPPPVKSESSIMPKGKVGGLPGENVGGMPKGKVGGMPEGRVGTMPRESVGGVAELKKGYPRGMPDSKAGGIIDKSILKSRAGKVVTDPRIFGMEPRVMRSIQREVNKADLKVRVREANDSSLAQMRAGHPPKHVKLKSKTINDLDVQLGAKPGSQGQVGYFKPKKPKNFDSLDPKGKLRERYKQRLKEYSDNYQDIKKMRDKGLITVEDGVVIDRGLSNTRLGENGKLTVDSRGPAGGTGKGFTGDHDMWDITHPDGRSIIMDPNARGYDAGAVRRKIMLQESLDRGLAQTQHGPHKDWRPITKRDIEIDQKIRGSHKPGGEALLEFAPGQPARTSYEIDAAGKIILGAPN